MLYVHQTHEYWVTKIQTHARVGKKQKHLKNHTAAATTPYPETPKRCFIYLYVYCHTHNYITALQTDCLHRGYPRQLVAPAEMEISRFVDGKSASRVCMWKSGIHE